MTYAEALELLELDDRVTAEQAKEQYRWLVKFYHPDNPQTGNAVELKRVIEAYNVVQRCL